MKCPDTVKWGWETEAHKQRLMGDGRLMLLSVSMVNVILNLLYSAVFAVNTWITPKCLKSKQLLK